MVLKLENETNQLKVTISNYEVDHLKLYSVLDLKEIQLIEKENVLSELKKKHETLKLENERNSYGNSGSIDKVAFIEFGNLVMKLVEQTGIGVELNKTNLDSNDAVIFFSYLSEMFDLIIKCINSRRLEAEKKVSRMLKELKGKEEEVAGLVLKVEEKFKITIGYQEKESLVKLFNKLILQLEKKRNEELGSIAEAAGITGGISSDELVTAVKNLKSRLQEVGQRSDNHEEGKIDSTRNDQNLFEINLELKSKLRKLENKIKTNDKYWSEVHEKATDIASHWSKFYFDLTDDTFEEAEGGEDVKSVLSSINRNAQQCIKYYHNNYTERKVKEEKRICGEFCKEFPDFVVVKSGTFVDIVGSFLNFVKGKFAVEKKENKELREGIEKLFEEGKCKVKKAFGTDGKEKTNEFSFKDKLLDDPSNDRISIKFDNESFGVAQNKKKEENKETERLNLINKQALELKELSEKLRMVQIESEAQINAYEDSFKGNLMGLVRESRLNSKGKEIAKALLRMLN